MSKKKFCLITGAGSGIGQAAAQKFSESGYELILVGRSREKLKATAHELKGPSYPLACDLAQGEQVEQLGQQVLHLLKDSQGHLKVLVNNAGVFDRTSFLQSSDEYWQHHFQNNLMSAVRLTRALFEPLKEAQAHVLNVSSTLGLRPVAETSAYSAMKAAMVNWTQSLALEWAPHQIRVNALAPGLIETPMHQHLLVQPEIKAQMQELQPLKRMGRPQEIAEAIYFLCSPASEWTTGSVLSVDGGIHL